MLDAITRQRQRRADLMAPRTTKPVERPEGFYNPDVATASGQNPSGLSSHGSSEKTGRSPKTVSSSERLPDGGHKMYKVVASLCRVVVVPEQEWSAIANLPFLGG